MMPNTPPTDRDAFLAYWSILNEEMNRAGRPELGIAQAKALWSESKRQAEALVAERAE